MNYFSTARLTLFMLLAASGCGNPSSVEVDDSSQESDRMVRLHFDSFMKSKSGAT